MISDGLSQKEIAQRTGRSRSTVRTHLHACYHRLGVPGAAQAVLVCVKAGWLDGGAYGFHGHDPALARLEALIAELVAAVTYRRERGLTARQRAYLTAFDEHLQAETTADRFSSRQEMNRRLADMLQEAGVRPPVGRRHSLIDVIAQWASRPGL